MKNMMKLIELVRKHKIMIGLLMVMGMFLMGVMGITHSLIGSGVDSEWEQKFPKKPRSSREIGSILTNMVKYRATMTPAFIPKHQWRSDLCAATIVNGVNLITGRKDHLKTTSAWLFSKANADKLKMVYDRSKDFTFEGDVLVEKVDRGFSLSKILGLPPAKQVQHLYIVGYSYHHTEVGRLVKDQGGTLNSHLMLLLGKYDGSWWGYHLFHDPTNIKADPFKIENLGDTMPKKFDLIYIWKVKNTRIKTGLTSRVLVQTKNYSKTESLLRVFGTSGLGRFFDRMFAQWFAGGENFPRTATERSGVVKVVETAKGADRGQILGFYNGVAVRKHQKGKSPDGKYGQEYQCVEYGNRFLVKALKYKNLRKSGHADTYFYGARAKGMIPYYNGKKVPPRVNDLIIFDPIGNDDVPGHVAVITKVTKKQVCIVQQNTTKWHECLPLQRKKDGTYFVKGRIYPCTGWSRIKKFPLARR